MYTLELGKQYDTTKSRHRERIDVFFGPSNCQISIFLGSPTDEEVSAFQSGRSEFALIVEGPDLLSLAFRFGDLAWQDAPFQVHKVRAEQQGLPIGQPEEPIHLRTVLIDADTGLVRALRADLLPGEFSLGLRASIWEQLQAPFDDAAAGRRLDQLYEKYPTSELMVCHRADERAVGEMIFGGMRPPALHFY